VDKPQIAGSISRTPMIVQILDKGVAPSELIRHLSPSCVRMILNCLPLQDRIHKYSDSIVYIETRLVIGAEKQRTQFMRGDIAYMTSNSSICIFTKDTVMTPMNPIGIVKSNLEIIESTRSGDIMILKKM